jgi:hypothetical protein
MVRGSDGKYRVDSLAKVIDAIGFASIVDYPTIVIGDNITAMNWESVDAVTPGIARIRVAYNWLKENIRDGHIDLCDIESLLSLADFLTKVVLGPANRAASDAASGYTRPPEISTALKLLWSIACTVTRCIFFTIVGFF